MVEDCAECLQPPSQSNRGWSLSLWAHQQGCLGKLLFQKLFIICYEEHSSFSLWTLRKERHFSAARSKKKPYAPYTKFMGKMFLEVILFPSSTCLAKRMWISSLVDGVVLETSRLVSLFWLLHYSIPDCHLGCFSGFILFLSVATFVSEFQKTVIIIYRRSWFTDFFSI